MWISTRVGQTRCSSRSKQYFGPLGYNLDAVGDCSCNQIKGNDGFRISGSSYRHQQTHQAGYRLQLHSKNSGEGSTGILKFTAVFLWHSKVSQTLFSRDKREFTISCCLLITALSPVISWGVVNILFIHWVNNVYFFYLQNESYAPEILTFVGYQCIKSISMPVPFRATSAD